MKGSQLTVGDVIQLLEAEGWFVASQGPNYWQYKHLIRSGKITIVGKMEHILSSTALYSIFKQAKLINAPEIELPYPEY